MVERCVMEVVGRQVGLSLLVAVDLWMVALVYCFILA
ncbi:hypothetical protein COLO4_09302 [Corchorus olitorius]|uniref:Uncharacterized protein n=1 Tax=Corchorus olitorius TaxID=93759 RepID=A0A1R3KCG5_9ROSI|nr:hypothetical protein COLO4_09302 [Corchorus olitorius]